MSCSEWRNDYLRPAGICAGTEVIKLILETGEENEVEELLIRIIRAVEMLVACKELQEKNSSCNS